MVASDVGAAFDGIGGVGGGAGDGGACAPGDYPGGSWDDGVRGGGDPAGLPAGALGPRAWGFGDPEPVLDRRDLIDLIECWTNGKWYEPPIPVIALTKAFRVGPHHSSAIAVKRNMLVSSFRETRYLDRESFSRAVLDYLVLGNGYFEIERNLLGGVLRLGHLVGRYMRRGVAPGSYFWAESWSAAIEFPTGGVLQVMEYDLNQELYGVPDYLSGLQSAFLNESATLFRRRYYINGSHAGYILYLSDPSQNEEDIDKLREALRKSKGPGNFRNLFLYSPNGKKDGVQVIPVSEAAAKDEFLGIKNTTRDDVLAAHRVPPQLLGVVPTNAGGFGAVGPAADAFHRFEIVPLQRKFLAVNQTLGIEAVAFEDYVPVTPVAAATGAG
ncbi:MAG: phage portal protein [Sphingomonadaceae bacterium]|nr:phage portal protein [Sphingomonadaceae bacterium]